MPAAGRVQPGADRGGGQRGVQPAPDDQEGPQGRLRGADGQEHHDEALRQNPLRQDRQQGLPQPHPSPRRQCRPHLHQGRPQGGQRRGRQVQGQNPILCSLFFLPNLIELN